MKGSPAQWRRRGVEAVSLSAVLAFAGLFAFVRGDIRFADETSYLTAGQTVLAGGERGPFSSSPGYADLYALLGRLHPDPIGLYSLGRVVSALLVVSAAWLAARMLVGRVPALVAAVTVAGLGATYVWPGVSGPATAAVVVAVALLAKTRAWYSLGSAAALVWLAASARPELWWIAVLLSLIAAASAGAGVKRRAPDRVPASIAAAIGALVVPTLVIARYGSPWSGASRSWVAFGQHYSIRQVEENGSPWLEWTGIVARDFPGATSVVDAVLGAPLAVLGHLAANAAEAGPCLLVNALAVGQAGPGSIPCAVPTGLHWWSALLAVPLGLVTVALIVALVRAPGRRKAAAGRWRRSLTASGPASPTALAILLGGLIVPVILVYPRTHYLQALVVIVVVLATAAVFTIGDEHLTAVVPAALALACVPAWLALIALPALIQTAGHPHPVAASLVQLRDEGRPLAYIGLEHRLGVYAPTLQHRREAPQGATTFADALERGGIEVVDIAGLPYLPSWGSLPGADDFARDPEAFGFRIVVPGSPLALRRD